MLKQKNPVLYDYLRREKEMFELIKEQIKQNAKKVESQDSKEDTIQSRLGQIVKALAYYDKQEV